MALWIMKTNREIQTAKGTKINEKAQPSRMPRLNRHTAKNGASRGGNANPIGVSATRITYPAWKSRPSRITQIARIMTKMENRQVG